MNAVERLAERLGIEPAFRDAAGELRRTSPDVRLAILAAMGVAVASDDDARAALDALEREEWDVPFTPTVACAGPSGVCVDVALPAATGTVRWTATLESGDRARGEARFPALPLVARRDAFESRRLSLGALPLGYHRLALEHGGDAAARATLAVVPRACHTPEGSDRGGGVWGIAVQLYALRSSRNFGIGDFTDLADLAAVAAGLGASAVGVNPLHAMFPDEPTHASPYSPSSRIFSNVLYLDVAAVPEVPALGSRFAAAEAAAARCRAAELVDYEAVAAAKLAVLDAAFERFEAAAEPARRERFARFRQERGDALERFCRFQALREHFKSLDRERADWRRWPPEYRDCRSGAVQSFAERHRGRIAFHAWTQWLADEALAASAARAEPLAIGLYRDLAVGADSSGAEAWSYPGLFVEAATAGAPPDVLNPNGQNWGLPPMNPRALRRDGLGGFVDLVRANMRHAGALRIDHAMALERLYWIPRDSERGEGAYVTYPLTDLLGVLALESRRARCVVIGEDLGTVPEGFRDRMRAANVLSYRVLSFEQEDGRLTRPRDYPRLALATIGSHDLATLRGWWQGHDIAIKQRKRLYPNAEAAAEQREQRARERRMLLAALAEEEIALPDGFDADSPYEDALALVVHELLGRTSAWLALTQLEDMTGELDQANLPGTVDEYPNWRRRLAVPLEALGTDERVRAIAALLTRLRPSPR